MYIAARSLLCTIFALLFPRPLRNTCGSTPRVCVGLFPCPARLLAVACPQGVLIAGLYARASSDDLRILLTAFAALQLVPNLTCPMYVCISKQKTTHHRRSLRPTPRHGVIITRQSAQRVRALAAIALFYKYPSFSLSHPKSLQYLRSPVPSRPARPRPSRLLLLDFAPPFRSGRCVC